MIEKRYCEKCGKEMKYDVWVDHFDRKTGKEIKMIRYYCPKIEQERFNIRVLESFNNSGMMMGHYVYEEKCNDNI